MKRFLIIFVILLVFICATSGLGALILREMNPMPETTDTLISDDLTTVTTPANSNVTNDDASSSDNTQSDPEESETQTDSPPPTQPLVVPQLNCTQVFVYDVTAGTYLYEMGTDQPILPASITKLLTALCALHYMPADALITPGDEQLMLKKGSSIAYVKSNHTLTLSMLIEGMMLPSGNDAALAVAAGVSRYLNKDPQMKGTVAVSAFMDLANEYAVSLGCTNTHFTVPDGFAYENHSTTAADLVIIAKAAMENEIIAGYASTVSEKVTYKSGHTMTWTNTNPLINPDSEFYSPYVFGLKTGSLADTFSVMVSAKIHGRTYIMGFFGSPTKDGRYQDCHTILNLLLAQTAE